MPKISVIVPVYKVEKYLRQCVESILNQTFHDFELILVDDGSPDRCGEICDQYASSDSRVKAIHQSNGGLSAARNAGLDVAAGEYLAFVDSDDFINEETLEAFYAFAVNNKVDLVVCNFKRVSEEDGGETEPPIHEFLLKDGIYSNKIALEGLDNRDYLVWTASWNKLYKRELFSSVRFPVGKVCEDVFIMHEIMFNCPMIGVINKKLYNYRNNSSSITNKRDLNYRLCCCEALISRMFFYEKNKMFENIKFAMERLMFSYFVDVLGLPKTTDPLLKKRTLRAKKEVRHFFYRYKAKIRFSEILYFEFPVFFNFIKRICHK